MTPSPSEFREEVEKLERKHAENPEGRYFVPLANAYRRSGDLRRAMSLLRQGLEKHPDYLSAHIVLGRCLADQGEAGAAEAEFRYVLSLDSQNLIALRTLGELAAGQRNVADARKWYEELLSVDPMNEDARRALENLTAGSEAEAADRRGDAQGDSPPWEWPASERITLSDSTATETATPDNHESHFGTMIDIDSSDSEATFGDEANAVVTETIAELYTRQGFYDRAADVYRELIRRRGSNAALEERLRHVAELAAGTSMASSSFAASDVQGSASATSDDSASGSDMSEVDADPFAASFEEGFAMSPVPADDSAQTIEFVESSILEIGTLTAGLGAPIDEPVGFEPGFEAEETMIFAQPSSPDAVETEIATGASAEPEHLSGGSDSMTIRNYLTSVLSWAPSAQSEQLAAADVFAPEMPEYPEAIDFGFPPDAGSAADDSMDIWAREGFVTDDIAPAGLQSDALDREIEATLPLLEPQDGAEHDHSWLTGSDFILEDEPAAATPAPEPVAEQNLPLASDLIDDELFPWELPASHPAVADAAEMQTTPVFTEDFPLVDEPHHLRQDPPETHVTESDAVPLLDPLAEPFAPAPHPFSPAPEGSDEVSKEDDDLESFQSWLRSLKR